MRRGGWVVRAVAGAAAALILLASGCHPGGPNRRELMLIASAWFTAIQDRDYDRLARFDAHAPPVDGPQFDEWKRRVAEVAGRYDAQKLEGRWTPDEIGYVTVRATLIGANPGTYWGAPGVEGSAEAPVLIIQATFAYDELGEQKIPPGTVIYAQGHPVGRVFRLKFGETEKKQVDLLDSIRMKVYFRRVDHPGPKEAPYRVERLELLENTAKHRVFDWVY